MTKRVASGVRESQVMSVHTIHPHWTAKQIAAHVGCHPATVRAVFYRKDLTLPTQRPLDTSSIRYHVQMAAQHLRRAKALGWDGEPLKEEPAS